MLRAILMSPRIDRDSLHQCIRCANYYPPEQLVGKAFPAGDNYRFYLCVACWRASKAGVCCTTCGDKLTIRNTELGRIAGGGYRVKNTRCLKCLNAEEREQKKQRKFRQLANRYPHILRGVE
jgi:hypothetical protein